MKNILLAFLAITISTSTLIAQHDVKFNVFGLFFKNYGLGYEYIIDDRISAGGFISYSQANLVTTILDNGSDDNFVYNSFNISPEFRYYFNPDFGADKRYVSGYLRYHNTNWGDKYNNDAGEYIDYIINLKGVGLGINTGKKWVTNSGIYIETLFGFGRFIYTNTTYSDEEIKQDLANTEEIEVLEAYSSWDFRFQISVGYRIGGY